MTAAVRYTSVSMECGGDETRNFGSRVEYLSPTSLYEVITQATINGDDESEVSLEVPSLKGASNGSDLAVLINRDLSLFDFVFSFKFVVTLHLAKDAETLSMCFLEESRVLVLLTQDGTLVFISAKLEKVMLRMKALEGGFIKGASMSCSHSSEKGFISVCSEDGSSILITISNYTDTIALLENDDSLKAIKTIESSMEVKSTRCGIALCHTEIMPALDAQFLYPSDKANDTRMALLSCPKSTYSLSEFGDDQDRGKCIRSLTCTHERYLLDVSEDGWLTVWDSLTMVQVSKKRVVSHRESVKGWTLLEGDNPISSLTQVLIAENDNGCQEVQVRSLKDAEVSYALGVGKGTQLLTFPPHEEFSILILEPYGFEQDSDEAGVRVRVITESQPDARLDRLLNRMKFDDAQLFATRFNLDLQKVHKSRVNSLLSEMAQSDVVSRNKFNSFMSYLELINDHNWVTEICIAGVTLCHSLDYISELLCYVDKRDVSDEETVEKLARLRYNLTSYRMLYGPKASFDADSAWNKFLEDNVWKEVFVWICEKGCFSEALMLWQRYIREMRDWVTQEQDTLEHIVNIIQQVLSVDVSKLWEAIELLELEIVPMALSVAPLSTMSVIVSFLQWLVTTLELEAPSDFPSNALRAVSMLHRAILSIIQQAVTPAEAAMVAHVLMQSRVDSEDVNDAMGQMNVYVKNLTEMDKLKNAYQCPMTYAKFTVETVESICYLILERVRNVQLVKANIERFAKPYMTEHRLDFNKTLYNYIIKASINSASLGHSNPWDERCLAVAEMITSKALRCEALIGIARRAQPPWSNALHAAVHSMLDDGTLQPQLYTRLRYECDVSELSKVMMSYTVSMSMLRACVRSKPLFRVAIQSVLRAEEVHQDSTLRLNDALMMVSLSQKIKPGLMTRVECITLFALYAIKGQLEEDSRNVLIKCLSELEQDERTEVINNLIVHVKASLNSPIKYMGQEGRLRKLRAVICVVERFCNQKESNQSLLKTLRGVRDLEVWYGMRVSLDVLEERSLKMELVTQFVNKRWQSNDALIWNEVCTLCNKLAGDQEMAFDVLLKAAVQHKDALSAVQFADKALSGVLTPSTYFLDSVLECCSFVLSMMPDLANDKDTELLIFVYDKLRHVVSTFLLVAPPDYVKLQTALNIATYVEMFDELVARCLTDEYPTNGEAASRRKTSDTPARDKTDIVWGMDSLVGVYGLSNDGHICDRIGAVLAIAKVANSIAGENKNNGKIQAYWNDLLAFLSVSNQTLMELCARSFYARLECFEESVSQYERNMEQCVDALCERIIVSTPPDLLLASTALLHLPVNSLQLSLEKLRKWSMSRKSPEAMLAFLRICQFTGLCRGFNQRPFLVMLEENYARNIWARRLSGVGASLPHQITPMSIITEFVGARVPVKVVVELCEDFSLDSSEVVLMYAMNMLCKCSTLDANTHRDMLHLAERAFALLDVTENILMRLYDCLMQMCPYDYEGISVLLKQMQKHLVQDNEQHSVLVTRLSVLLQFLVNVSRRALVTPQEKRWFHDRNSFISRSSRNDQSLLSEVEGGQLLANDLFESRDSLDVVMPSRALHCLPFHPFLFDDPTDIHSTLLPIIYHELTIYNCELWIELMRQMPGVPISKSDLLAKSILLLVNSRTESGTVLEKEDIDKMRCLVFSTSNRVGVAKALMAGIRQIPLCETKMQLLALGIDVAKMWHSAEGSQLEKPIQESEKKGMAVFANYLSTSHKRYSSELLLKKFGVLNTETLDLIKTPTDLIIHIYSNEISWDDSNDKGTKLELVNELMELHGLDRSQIHAELLERWLAPNESNGMLGDGTSDTSKELVYKLPYMDASVTRVVHLLRSRSQQQAADYLTNLIEKDSSQVSYDTKIRCLCCLMRILNSDQFVALMGYQVTDACVKVEYLLYARLIDVCRLDLPLAKFKEHNKALLARSLLSSGVRQNMELMHLIACLVVDYDVAERKLVGELLTKLYGARQRQMLARLLLLCRYYPALARINDIPLFWRDIAHSMRANCDDKGEMADGDLRRFVFFCLSCPAEGGRVFDSLQAEMKSDGVLVGSQLLSLVASPTRKELPTVSTEGRSKADLQMNWSD